MKRKMRVLFLNHHPSLYGATRSLVDLVTELQSFGVASKVVSPSDGPVGPLLKGQGVEHEVAPFSWSMAVQPNNAIDRMRRAVKNCRIVPKLCGIARQWDADVIYTNSSVISVGLILSKMLRRPHVWHLREMGDLDYDLCHDFGGAFFRMLLGTSEGLVANSKAVADHLCPRRIRHRVKVIYNGIAPRARFEKLLAARGRPLPGSSEFLMVGAVMPGKGQAEAIQAMAMLQNELRDARLTILGGGNGRYLSECRSLCTQLGLQDRVEFFGEVCDPFPFYARATALLVCSRAEAMGRVTAEAMASGCPVIGRASGGTGELIADGETGFLYSGGVESLARCMTTVLRSPDLASDISRRAWVRARERFPVENYAQGVLAMLEEVVRVTSRSPPR